MKKIYLSLIVFIILISLFGCGENNEVKKTVKAPGDVPVPLPSHFRTPGGRVGRVRRQAEGPDLSGVQRGEERRVVQGQRPGAGRPRLGHDLRAVGLRGREQVQRRCRRAAVGPPQDGEK